MRALVSFVLFTLFVNVLSKGNSQKSAALTESMGQEVIEIGAPIKEVPPGIEEEPSAENDSADYGTATTGAGATKKDGKKNPSEARRKVKDVDRIDGVKTDDDEIRIEKELADIYKDNVDYVSEEAAVPTTKSGDEEVTDDGKKIARLRESFKFSPDDLSDKREVERFKTSVDDISCAKIKQKESDDESSPNGSTSSFETLMGTLFLLSATPLALLLR